VSGQRRAPRNGWTTYRRDVGEALRQIAFAVAEQQSAERRDLRANADPEGQRQLHMQRSILLHHRALDELVRRSRAKDGTEAREEAA
jgi:hypothetical protein